MPLTAAKKQKLYRERLKNNTEKYEEAKKKHRERYHKTKRLVKDFTPKEKYNANVKWKLRKRQLKERKKAQERLLQETPPVSPISDSGFEHIQEINVSPPPTPPQNTPPCNIPPRSSATPSCASSTARSPSLAVKVGRKKVKKERSRVQRENAKLRQENETLKRKYEKYKKRYHRKIEFKMNETDYLKYKLLSGAIKKTLKKTKSRKEREVIKKKFSPVEVKNSKMKNKILKDNLGSDKIVNGKGCLDKNTVLKKKIKNVYYTDDVSRATAGKKETVTKGETKTNLEFTENLNLENILFSDDGDEPLSNMKITKQLLDITNRPQRMYDKIYGHSSLEEEPCGSYDKNSKISCGDYLLVKLHVNASKHKYYSYVCKALTDVEEDGEIKVMFLRVMVMDENAKLFRLDDKDISYVDYDDIIQKLPVPEVIKKGYRSYYKFKNSVDVFEKK